MSRVCAECGATLSDESVFCPNCGRLAESSEAEPAAAEGTGPAGSGEAGSSGTVLAPPPTPAPAAAKKKLSPAAITAIVVGAVVVLAGLGIAVWLLLGGVKVPDLEGMSLDEAERALERADLELGKVDYDPDADEDLWSVIDQDPASGERLKKGSEVDITLAGGEPVEVPNLVGISLENAVEALEDVGLGIGDIDEEFDEDVPEGYVLDQDPEADDTLPEGAGVDLVVSKGPEVLEVPDVVGESEDDAIEILEDQGFGWSIETRDSAEPEGTVLEQYPEAGEEVEPGTMVDLIVSTGIEMVKVPNWTQFRAPGNPDDYPDFGALLEATEEAIEEGFAAAGLVAVIEWAPWEEGVQSTQAPAAGAWVPAGTTVYLKLYVAD